MSASWVTTPKPIRGVLLDITGVLYESGEGGGAVIPGSVEAFKRLKSANIPVRLVTNETSTPREDLVVKLQGFGYPVEVKDVFSPVPAVVAIMKSRGETPHLLINPQVEAEFKDVCRGGVPNCVVIGDADHHFSFENMNKAFNVLIEMNPKKLYSLGMGKYYKHGGKLQLDLGVFTRGLEFACDVQAEIVGKPSPQYFQAALDDMNVPKDEALMVGDDINSDVGGSQKHGLRGVLVRTGKFTPANENHPTVSPDFIADNLSHAVDILLKTLNLE